MTKESEPLPCVVILISANQEWLAVKEILNPSVLYTMPYGEWFTDPQNDRFQVIFCQGGWGKTSAAGSTQYAIDTWHPAYLMNLGTCGGFDGRVQTGDVILVEKTIIYDLIEQMLDADTAIQDYSTNMDLSFIRKPYPQPVIQTVMVSADRDLVASQIPSLVEKYGAIAGDWETGSIAYVANLNRIHCLVLRGVSDLVHPATGGEAYDNISLFSSRTRMVMENLLLHLPQWLACLA